MPPNSTPWGFLRKRQAVQEWKRLRREEVQVPREHCSVSESMFKYHSWSWLLIRKLFQRTSAEPAELQFLHPTTPSPHVPTKDAHRNRVASIPSPSKRIFAVLMGHWKFVHRRRRPLACKLEEGLGKNVQFKVLQRLMIL